MTASITDSTNRTALFSISLALIALLVTPGCGGPDDDIGEAAQNVNKEVNEVFKKAGILERKGNTSVYRLYVCEGGRYTFAFDYETRIEDDWLTVNPNAVFADPGVASLEPEMREGTSDILQRVVVSGEQQGEIAFAMKTHKGVTTLHVKVINCTFTKTIKVGESFIIDLPSDHDFGSAGIKLSGPPVLSMKELDSHSNTYSFTGHSEGGPAIISIPRQIGDNTVWVQVRVTVVDDGESGEEQKEDKKVEKEEEEGPDKSPKKDPDDPCAGGDPHDPATGCGK